MRENEKADEELEAYFQDKTAKPVYEKPLELGPPRGEPITTGGKVVLGLIVLGIAAIFIVSSLVVRSDFHNSAATTMLMVIGIIVVIGGICYLIFGE